MEMMKVKNREMEVAMIGGVMIGKCKGPVKPILPAYENKIEELKQAAGYDVKPVEIRTSIAVWRNIDIIPYDGEIDLNDYNKFCQWMVENNEELRGLHDYRLAVAYYSRQR